MSETAHRAVTMLPVGYALGVVSVHLRMAPFAEWGTEGAPARR